MQAHDILDKIGKMTIAKIQSFFQDFHEDQIDPFILRVCANFNDDWTIEKISQNLKAWTAFELSEPGYLKNALLGLQCAFQSLLDNEELTVDLIHKIHRICSQELILSNSTLKPGKFIDEHVYWYIGDCDTKKGFSENLNYASKINTHLNKPLISIKLFDFESKLIEFFPNERNTDQKFIDQLWNKFKSGAEATFNIYANIIDSNFFQIISTKLIKDLEKDLNESVKSIDKLVAIYTFLKHIVFLHPYSDAVGRTYSMILMQYLLIKSDFVPVLFKNSNMIPGASIQELVDEYYRAEKEMFKILKKPDYISSVKIHPKNFNTKLFYRYLSEYEKDYFDDCTKIFDKIKNEFLRYNRCQSIKN